MHRIWTLPVYEPDCWCLIWDYLPPTLVTPIIPADDSCLAPKGCENREPASWIEEEQEYATVQFKSRSA
jgi:hypothetical protein